MNHKLKSLIIILPILFIASIIMTHWLSFNESVRMIFGSAFILFFPGFAWADLLFKKIDEDQIEYITVCIALSTAIVPVALFIGNALGMKINLINVVILVSTIIISGIIGDGIRVFTRKNAIKSS